MAIRLLRLLALLPLLALAACSGGEERPGGASAPSAAGELQFYNWEDYVLPELLDEFERESGTRVRLHAYRDEDDILAALQAGLNDADLVVVSSNIVRELQQARLLRRLDPALMPNLRHARAHPRFNVVPGDGLVAVPYMVGTLGVVVNRRHVPDERHGWDVLWDPAYAGHIAMLDNSLDAIDAGFRSLGYSINSENPAEAAAVREHLLTQQPLLLGYISPVSMSAKLISGELWAAQLYNGDALAAEESNQDLRYYVPAEGSTLWVDCLVVPAMAPHPEAAMRLIDFLHRPEIMARNATYVRYQPVNEPALALLPRELRDSPVIFPPREVLERCEMPQPIRTEAMRERLAIWAELQRRAE